uniref:Monocarboxylate transporter n=1 Tax=Ixodes ricinus TaxID=34613 RepID=V5H730_IXORI
MAVLLAFMGICFLLLPFANWYTFLLIVTCAIGFGIGTCLVSASVIVTQRVSVEMTSVAFGVVCGICGILSFGKPTDYWILSGQLGHLRRNFQSLWWDVFVRLRHLDCHFRFRAI